MQLHQLKSKKGVKEKKRIGRGGKRGTYSGRGQKGQRSRAGRKMKPAIREFIKRYPKLRGYKFKPQTLVFKPQTAIVNLDVLDKNFDSKEKITPEALLEKGLVDKIKGKTPKVKILGRGELKKAFIVQKCFVSKKAKEKIEKSGGQVK